MRNKNAFLFPGQGSQYVGMGQDLIAQFPAVKDIFKQADDICQKPISNLCFEGPMEDLTLTENLQPAVTAVNLACLAALKKSGIEPSISAGHSLGEYAALVSAGVLDDKNALRLVNKRGELMHRESLSNPGSMVAVIGLDINGVQKLVEDAKGDGILAVANHNTAEQIVITGEEAPLSRAVQSAKDIKVRAVPLKVSGAWHCDLMAGAIKEFREFMEDIPFNEPKTTVLFNATAETETNPDSIKDIMTRQLTSPVKWYDIMQGMLRDGVNTFVEVGPKQILCGLLKKTVSPEDDVGIYQVGDTRSLGDFVKAISGQ